MKDKLGAAAACLLFAVCFGAVGVFASWAVGVTVYDGMRAKDWVRVKADVRSWSNNDIDYTYTIGGREYRGSRLGAMPFGGSSDVDSWDGDIHDYLSTAISEKKPISVFVNPDNPAESMVDRTIRWKLLVFFLPFALGFGGVGVGAMWMMFRTLVPATSSPTLPQGGGRKANAQGGGSGLLGLWVFTFFWNVIAFPIAILFVPQIIESGEWVGLFVLLFPMIGTLMLWGAVAGTWRYLRTGDMMPTPSPTLPQGGGRKTKMVETMEEFAEQAKAFVREDEPRAVSLGPDMRSVEEMLNGAGIKMTSQQAEMLKQLTPAQRHGVEQAVSIGRKVPWHKVIMAIVMLYILWQFADIVIMVLRSD
jgi:hypothetical protein